MELANSRTHENLMRAFAGESQARNRYTFAAGAAKKMSLSVVEGIFTFTAGQEKEHAEVFYGLLRELSGSTITVDGTYPVMVSQDIPTLLRSAQHNEMEEFGDVYPAFAAIAREEGFTAIGDTFARIAEIERTHGERFGRTLERMQQGNLFRAQNPVKWMCLNCGYVHEGTDAPLRCPVCDHDQGYFIRFDLAPYEGAIKS